MRIAVVCYPSYGGSGVVASELGKAMAARGHQVHFVSYELPFRLRGYQHAIIFHQVEVPTYPLFKYPPYVLALTNKLVELARYGCLDIIHAHYAIPHAVSSYLAKQLVPEVVTITTLHGTDITLVGSDPSFSEIISFAINRSDGVTAVSRSLRAETYRRFTVHRPIRVIPNFVDLQAYRRRPNPELRRCFAPGGEKIVIHVSNFRPVKRVLAVVEIVAQIREYLPVRLLLVGDGPDVPAARRRTRELGLEEAVLFVGRQDDLVPLLSVADLFLLPSAQESFGLAALEAMACGVPVVASRVGGLPEVVDEHSGRLHEVEDLEGMARSAVQIMSEQGVWEDYSEGARRRAEQFDAQRLVDAYEEFYREILASRRGA